MTGGTIYGTIYVMRKTTVYLSEEAVYALRRLAAQTGSSQADLVRDAIETYVAERAPKRQFRSAGIGASGRTDSIADQDEEEILRRDVTRESGWR